MPSKGKVPERWLNYSKVGEVIPGSRFICFKCPLREELQQKVPKSQRFTVADLVNSVTENGNCLGHVIDLTFTSRYYNVDELSSEYAIGHSKLCVSGFEEDDVDCELGDKFVQTVNEAKKNLEEDSLIGIHCTHGVNRTGFVVCFYLMKVMMWSFTKAVRAFERARGHKIEKDDYLLQLRQLEKSWTENYQMVENGDNKQEIPQASADFVNGETSSAFVERSEVNAQRCLHDSQFCSKMAEIQEQTKHGEISKNGDFQKEERELSEEKNEPARLLVWNENDDICDFISPPL